MSESPASSGRYVEDASTGQTVRAFVPAPLPPDLWFSMGDLDGVERASVALGRLDGVLSSSTLPAGFANLMTHHLVRNEALRSTQIEGTAVPLADLLAYEGGRAPGVPLADVREVSRYVAALTHGGARIREGAPLSLQLIRDVHELLLLRRRGGGKMPGLFRASQIWVGGSGPGTATLVPPPPGELMGCLEALERFFQDPTVPALVKAGLVHVQFETIHPFLDGNGRVGRILLLLQLCQADVLAEPVLGLSGFFAAHREEYDERLQSVRTHGAWAEWLRFFLAGVEEAATDTRETLEQAIVLFADHAAGIATFGRGAASAQAVYADLLRHPITTIPASTARLALTFPTVQAALGRLEAAGIVREVAGGGRGRVYAYAGLLGLLDGGPEAR